MKSLIGEFVKEVMVGMIIVLENMILLIDKCIVEIDVFILM